MGRWPKGGVAGVGHRTGRQIDKFLKTTDLGCYHTTTITKSKGSNAFNINLMKKLSEPEVFINRF